MRDQPDRSSNNVTSIERDAVVADHLDDTSGRDHIRRQRLLHRAAPRDLHSLDAHAELWEGLALGGLDLG
jgi:hypothetical protein